MLQVPIYHQSQRRKAKVLPSFNKTAFYHPSKKESKTKYIFSLEHFAAFLLHKTAFNFSASL